MGANSLIMASARSEPVVPSAPVRVEMLGRLQLVGASGRVCRLPLSRPAALLGCLCITARREHTREELVDVLWPDADPAVGRNRLKQALHILRQSLRDGGIDADRLLDADRETLLVNRAEFSTDVAEFESHVRAAAEADSTAEQIALLERAAALCRGELLQGFYDQWIEAERNRLLAMQAEAESALADALERTGDMSRALDIAFRLVQANPLEESCHQRVMRLQIALGQPVAAARQFRELERILKRELDELPSPSTRQLFAKAQEVGAAGLPPQPERPPAAMPAIDTIGGALPLNSTHYIEREADHLFRAAIGRRDSIVLIKGPRQVGKSSLLARGAQHARSLGAEVVVMDLQKLQASQFESVDSFHTACARMVCDQLGLSREPEEVWLAHRSANDNLERYLLREVLRTRQNHVVWCLDEVDRLFGCSFGSEVFALFRSWHNERALNPDGPWSRFTLAIAYATEAHLFISDLNQSPFNVGTRLVLGDFTLEDVAALNSRFGSPLRETGEVARLYEQVGGCPYLAHRALHEISSRLLALPAFLKEASREDGPFHDHLHRILMGVRKDPVLLAAVHEILRGRPCPTSEAFYRLRSAGILVGDSLTTCRLRCGLYAEYLGARLP